MKPLAWLMVVGLLALAFVPGLEVKAGGSRLPALTPAWVVENVGQFPEPVRFQLHLNRQTLWLLDRGLWLVEGNTALWLGFEGAQASFHLEGLERRTTRLSYWTEAGLFTDVPVWWAVRYGDLYPGVDLVLDGAGWHWLGAPEKLRSVHLTVQGGTPEGHEGALRLLSAGHAFTLPPAWSYDAAGRRLPLTYALTADGLALQVAPSATAPASLNALPDRPQDLLYSTFLGGGDNETVADAALGPNGTLYLIGETASTNFPTRPGASLKGETDVFLARLNASGSDLLYALLIGGADWDIGRALAVDAAGNAYGVGETYSLGFPTSEGAWDRTLDGWTEAFAFKVDAAGAFVYATLMGGSDDDRAYGVAVDGSGNAYVTGVTTSSDFPATAGAWDTSYNGAQDGFVVKLNATGSAPLYATYLGGLDDDLSRAIAVDGSGGAYLTGWTESANFPVITEAFRPQSAGGREAFAVRLGNSGGTLVYGTYLGGNGDDEGTAVVVDGSNNAYIVGETHSADFPTTAGAWQSSFRGGITEGFLVRLSSTGRTLSYGTFVGGGAEDQVTRLRLTGLNSVYLAGHTRSADFPVTSGAYATHLAGDYDGFLVYLNLTTSTLLYGTFIGGSGADYVSGLVADNDAVYLAGVTRSSTFPVTAGAFDTTYGGEGDGYALKLALTYAVAGRITDGQARPIAGVTLTVTPGNRTATTDAQGRYLLDGLSAGTYLLTPVRPGFTFSPFTRLISVPTSVEGVDFVMAPAPALFTLQPAVGHTVTLTDTLGQTATFTFPVGVVTQTTAAQIRLLPGQQGGGYYAPGLAYTLVLTAAGGSPALVKPVTVSLQFLASAVAPLRDKQDLRLMVWTGSDWAEAGTTCAPALGQTYAAASRRLEAAFCRAAWYNPRGPAYQLNLPIVLRRH